MPPKKSVKKAPVKKASAEEKKKLVEESPSESENDSTKEEEESHHSDSDPEQSQEESHSESEEEEEVKEESESPVDSEEEKDIALSLYDPEELFEKDNEEEDEALDFDSLMKILDKDAKSKHDNIVTEKFLFKAFDFFPCDKNDKEHLTFNPKKNTFYLKLREKYKLLDVQEPYEVKVKDKMCFCDRTSEFMSYCEYLQNEFKDSKKVKLKGVRIQVIQKNKVVLEYKFS